MLSRAQGSVCSLLSAGFQWHQASQRLNIISLHIKQSAHTASAHFPVNTCKSIKGPQCYFSVLPTDEFMEAVDRGISPQSNQVEKSSSGITNSKVAGCVVNKQIYDII